MVRDAGFEPATPTVSRDVRCGVLPMISPLYTPELARCQSAANDFTGEFALVATSCVVVVRFVLRNEMGAGRLIS